MVLDDSELASPGGSAEGGAAATFATKTARVTPSFSLCLLIAGAGYIRASRARGWADPAKAPAARGTQSLR